MPFIARWKGRIVPGETIDELLCLTDIYASLAELAGQEPDEVEAEDSYSFLPLLRGEELVEPPRDSIVHHSVNGVFAVRRGPWKLIEGLGSGGFTQPASIEPEEGGAQGQLYNLEDDPAESNNLWLERPDIVKELAALLDEIRQESDGNPQPAE